MASDDFDFRFVYGFIAILLICFLVFLFRFLRISNFTQLGTTLGVKGAVAKEGTEKIKNLDPEDAEPIRR